jgi:hypothetical protein
MPVFMFYKTMYLLGNFITEDAIISIIISFGGKKHFRLVINDIDNDYSIDYFFAGFKTNIYETI